MRCNRCLNDETVRGISFDSSGVCNFCHNFDEIKEKLADENMLHQLFQERVDAVRGKHRYDAALGISGGKTVSLSCMNWFGNTACTCVHSLWITAFCPKRQKGISTRPYEITGSIMNTSLLTGPCSRGSIITP